MHQGAVLALAAALGCGPGGNPSSEAARGDAAGGEATLFPAALPSYMEDGGVFPGGDPGIGMVYFVTGDAAVPGVLRLALREQPRDEAALVGRFDLSMPDGSEWSWRVLAREPDLRANLVEFSYEEWGVPFDSASPDGRWVRLIHARGRDGSYRHGWARIEDGVERAVWREWLGERAHFFADGSRIELRDEPAGNILVFELSRTDEGWPPGWDHHLEPDSTAGDWVRVRVVTPSDACGIEPSSPVRDTVAWTKTVDERGRPLVWFYARGC